MFHSPSSGQQQQGQCKADRPLNQSMLNDGRSGNAVNDVEFRDAPGLGKPRR